MEIVNAYEVVGSYRGAAALCGTTPKTVKRVLERRAAGQVGRRSPPPRARKTAPVTDLITERVRATDGRISAKRLLPLAQTAGYAGSARYLVPQDFVGRHVEVVAAEGTVCIRHAGTEVIRHDAVAPGEVACGDLMATDRRPTRAVRPRTPTAVAFLGMGPAAEAFLRTAAAAGTARLASELAAILDLEPGWGRELLLVALERATRFRRFKAADVRAILTAGAGVPTPERAGAVLTLTLPVVPVRPLSAYAVEVGR